MKILLNAIVFSISVFFFDGIVSFLSSWSETGEFELVTLRRINLSIISGMIFILIYRHKESKKAEKGKRNAGYEL
ncbi:hypothetical protein [Sphingobacterium lactis]|uniref:hypothetical protein n=1 Tax=Sphingobacterium lactis TaxID=797291 RepID=UPI003DA3F289